MTITVSRDLRASFGDARNQGHRPTCCAFACSDLHASRRFPWSALSCEYAFFRGAKRQGTGPERGVHLRHMLDAIEHDGQPIEEAWPYLSSILGDPAVAWAPPKDVGELFRAQGVRASGGLPEIRAVLDAGNPAIVVLSVSDAFYFGPDANGVIDSAENPDPARVHAVVAVGHGTHGSEGMILVRNSWGIGWGLDGHAWVTDRYLGPRLIEIATLTKVI